MGSIQSQASDVKKSNKPSSGINMDNTEGVMSVKNKINREQSGDAYEHYDKKRDRALLRKGAGPYMVLPWLAVVTILTVSMSLFEYYSVLRREHTTRHFTRGNETRNGDLESVIQDSMSKYSQPSTKYLVYECTKARGDECSGWSDRIAGIMTTFIISILSKRKFLINFDKPCLLQDYVTPAHYDWRYNSSILLNRTSSYHNFRRDNYTKIEQYMFGGIDFNTYFKHDVIFVLFNRDFIRRFSMRPNISDDIPWISKYHQMDIYKHVYNFLFKFSPLGTRAWNKYYIKQRQRKRIACAHIRRGDNSNMPGDGRGKLKLPLNMLWKYFDTLNKDEYDLFVASDTDSVKASAKKRYPENMIDTPGKITHIDKPHINDPIEGFLKQLLDFYILVDCDILIIPPDSGFSRLAAFLRSKTDGVYCWSKTDIIPCFGYAVSEVFPLGKFSGYRNKT